MEDKTENAFDKIKEITHFWRWLPDWNVVKKIYIVFPNSFSVLTPFVFSYLEEMIRTNTSDYCMPHFNIDGHLEKNMLAEI